MIKRYFSVAVLFTAIYACGGQGNQENNQGSQQVSTAVETEQEHEGKQLLVKLGCNACHAEKRKIVGPSYLDIANKYDITEANEKYLKSKIVEGGSGVWGDIMMTPYPQLTESELKNLVDYIFTLKN